MSQISIGQIKLKYIKLFWDEARNDGVANAAPHNLE
jgi:hypothetical protein